MVRLIRPARRVGCSQPGGEQMRRRAILLSALVAGWLSGPLSAQAVIEHPLPDHIARAMRATANVSIETDSITAKQNLIKLALRTGLVIAFGELEEPVHLVFGEIVDGILDSLGNTYLLDQRFNVVRVFGPTGSLLQELGRPGRGPGEFTRPQSLTRDASGRLLVGDITREIHIFQGGGGALRYERSVRLPVAPYDMCVMGNRIFVHGFTFEEQRLIHEVDLTGRVLRSFGEVYNSDNSLVVYQISRGKISCDASTGIVVFAPDVSFGEVRGYSADGEPRWTTTLNGFRALGLTERGRVVAMNVPPDGYHALRSLASVGPGRVVAQFSLMTHESLRSRRPPRERLSIVLQTADGVGTPVGNTLPEGILSARSGRLLSAVSEPFPRATVWRLN